MSKYKPDGYELQVGDRIACFNCGGLIRILDVTRLTKTQAVCEVDGWKVFPRFPRAFGFHFKKIGCTNRAATYRVLA